jgi:hypothetical protein
MNTRSPTKYSLTFIGLPQGPVFVQIAPAAARAGLAGMAPNTSDTIRLATPNVYAVLYILLIFRFFIKEIFLIATKSKRSFFDN